MTNIIPKKNSMARWLLSGMMIWLMACGPINESKGKEQKMTYQEMSLWQLIDNFAQQMPLSREKVETITHSRLTEKKHDEYLVHFTGGHLSLKEGVTIAAVDLVLGPNGEFDATSGLSLEIEGACIVLDELRKRYGLLEIIQHPRGRSLQETTVHAIKLPWGSLSFAFKEQNPDCLSRVTFRI